MRTGAASAVGVRCHNENDVIMVMGAASVVGARRHNENDVTMTIAGLLRYGDWRHVATGCTALVQVIGDNTQGWHLLKYITVST